MANPTASARTRLPGILKALDGTYPDARCTLNFSTPLELCVATVLSAQCTDSLVNKVTPDLFRKYRSARDYATAPLPTLEHDLSRVNFYRKKAKSIKAAAQVLVERFGAQVPDRMEDLLQLPGVARKTANVILGNAFGRAEGIVVDTHVMRLSQRMALTLRRDRDKIEQDLLALVPRTRWIRFAHQMILHGRSVCTAKTPKCRECPLGRSLCPSYEKA